jgi:hypothetical protein
MVVLLKGKSIPVLFLLYYWRKVLFTLLYISVRYTEKGYLMFEILDGKHRHQLSKLSLSDLVGLLMLKIFPDMDSISFFGKYPYVFRLTEGTGKRQFLLRITPFSILTSGFCYLWISGIVAVNIDVFILIWTWVIAYGVYVLDLERKKFKNIKYSRKRVLFYTMEVVDIIHLISLGIVPLTTKRKRLELSYKIIITINFIYWSSVFLFR